jgi:dTDP-4-amino-4,6-dideoxygalactose transaminase
MIELPREIKIPPMDKERRPPPTGTRTSEGEIPEREPRPTFLSFSPPSIGEEEIAEVVDTLRSGWITTGPKVERFEREFASFVGAPAALAVSSGTAALHLSLLSLGIGPGDGVITTPMTFCSTVHVIQHVGARPILVDVEPDTLNIDPRRIEDALKCAMRNAQSAIKAVIPVHLYGHPCEMDSILDLAGKYGLAVIEDAAHALPARYKGRLIGSPFPHSALRIPQLEGGGLSGSSNSQFPMRNSQLTCFSFYGTKNLTTGEGGMLTGPPGILKKARVLSLHGMSKDAWKRYSAEGSWFYEVVEAGFKYNLTDLCASLGLAQLRKLEKFHARRREIARRYDEAFSRVPQLQTPTTRSEVDSAWHLYVLRLNLERLTLSRNRFIEELKAGNIGTSVHFIPVHFHPYYRDRFGWNPEDFPVASGEFERIVSLPLHPGLEDRDVEDVIHAVLSVVRKSKR